MNAEVICTSLDLCNNLDPLQRTEKDLPFEIYQAFSPDSILRIGDIESFKKDLSKLEALTNIKICTLDNLIEALKTRHDFFDTKGCRLSHHSISYFPFSPSPASEVSIIVKQVIDHNFVGLTDVEKYQTYILTQIAKWNYEKKWIQLFHVGFPEKSKKKSIQPIDITSELDSTNTWGHVETLGEFLSHLSDSNHLAKTIVHDSCFHLRSSII